MDPSFISYTALDNRNPATADLCLEYTPLELDRWAQPAEFTDIRRGCLVEDEFDTRYQNVSETDYSVSQLEVEDRSGVYDILNS